MRATLLALLLLILLVLAGGYGRTPHIEAIVTAENCEVITAGLEARMRAEIEHDGAMFSDGIRVRRTLLEHQEVIQVSQVTQTQREQAPHLTVEFAPAEKGCIVTVKEHANVLGLYSEQAPLIKSWLVDDGKLTNGNA